MDFAVNDGVAARFFQQAGKYVSQRNHLEFKFVFKCLRTLYAAVPPITTFPPPSERQTRHVSQAWSNKLRDHTPENSTSN